MQMDKLEYGRSVEDINVLIEISQDSAPVKYEFDKIREVMFVDRFLNVAMHYPCNYGFIPHTLSGDGDPVDVLVLSSYPVAVGCVMRARPVGVLLMEDEKGQDEKIIAVPHCSLDKSYHEIRNIGDVAQGMLKKIEHFFKAYKELEEGKWVKILGWGDVREAQRLIQEGIDRGQ